MKIAIDLDNTIINYDNAFFKVGKTLNLITDNLEKSKIQIRNYLRAQGEVGELNWQKLQGNVYGKYIHFATLFVGFKKFLWRSKYHNYKVHIVSHKTIYGNFDEEKILLREVAINFLSDEDIKIGDNKEIISINFFNTKDEKIKFIDSNNFDILIDDLPEIIEFSYTSIQKKILFNPPENYINQNKDNKIIKINNWFMVDEYIFDRPKINELQNLLEYLNFVDIKNISWINGLGNSRIAFFNTIQNKKKYTLKFYSYDKEHDRLYSEYESFNLLIKNNINDVPKPHKKDIIFNLGIYEFIDGEIVNNPTNKDIDKLIKFLNNLINLSNNIALNNFQRASASCLSLKDILNQVSFRYNRLISSVNDNIEIFNFLRKDFLEYYNFLYNNLNKESNWNEDLFFPKESLILSPSDFGFHNLLKKENGEFVFLDFEYFGWDDPAKLIVDVKYHPAMNLSPELRKYWEENVLKLFNITVINRYKMIHKFYALIWCLILLNEFIPDVWERRLHANPDKLKFKEDILLDQFTKSKNFLSLIKEEK